MTCFPLWNLSIRYRQRKVRVDIFYLFFLLKLFSSFHLLSSKIWPLLSQSLSLPFTLFNYLSLSRFLLLPLSISLSLSLSLPLSLFTLFVFILLLTKWTWITLRSSFGCQKHFWSKSYKTNCICIIL